MKMSGDTIWLIILSVMAVSIAVYLLREKLFGKKPDFNYYDDIDDDSEEEVKITNINL